MCWNEHVSMNTFLFSSFVLGLVLYNNLYTPYKIKEIHSLAAYLFLLSIILIYTKRISTACTVDIGNVVTQGALLLYTNCITRS